MSTNHSILTGYEVNFICYHTFEIFASIERSETLPKDSGDVFMNAVCVIVSSPLLHL